jgi:hypothetical protein
MNNLASWGYSYNPQEYEYLENYKSLLSDTINTAKSNINLPTEKPLHVQIKDDKEKFYKSRQSFVEICNKKKGHVIVDNGYMRCAPSIKGQSDGGLISFPNQDNNNRNQFENVKEAIKAVDAGWFPGYFTDNKPVTGLDPDKNVMHHINLPAELK